MKQFKKLAKMVQMEKSNQVAQQFVNDLLYTIEKENINRITNDENEANHILDLLKENEVTPVVAREVVEDYIKC